MREVGFKNTTGSVKHETVSHNWEYQEQFPEENANLCGPQECVEF